MAARVAGAGVLPDTLTYELYLPGRRGSLQAEKMGSGRWLELLAYQLQPTLESMVRGVAAGNPMIVL
ncbi:MAG: hypothetical protein ACK5RC_14285 [Curvibacter sp.]|jgi:hypothetical protein|nr:hypothetical protein [Curvibacter sp.]